MGCHRSWVLRAIPVPICHASTGAWSESSLITIPSFRSRSFASKTRKTCRREREGFERCFKQRQVDILTKSSLRLPINRTVVYIYRGFSDHGRDIKSYRTTENRSERNQIEWKRSRGGIERDRRERKG